MNNNLEKIYHERSLPNSFKPICCSKLLIISQFNNFTISNLKVNFIEDLNLLDEQVVEEEIDFSIDGNYFLTFLKEKNSFCHLIIKRIDKNLVEIMLSYNRSPPSHPLLAKTSYFLTDYMDDLDFYVTKIQILVEKYILEYTQSFIPKVQIKFKKTPSIMDKISEDKLIEKSDLNPFVIIFFYLGFTFPTIFFNYQIVQEKENGIKSYITSLGVKEEIYLLSWLSDGLITSFINTCIFLIIVYSNSFYYLFSNCSSSIIFIISMTYGFSIYCFSMFLCCFVKNVKSTTMLSIAFLLIGLGCSIVISSFQSEVYKIFKPQLYPIGIFLSIFPFLNLNKILYDIVKVTNIKGVGIETENDISRQYHWSNFTHYTPNKNFYFNSPTAFQSTTIMFISGVTFLILAWYFEKVMNNRNLKGKWTFMFKKDYWFPEKDQYNNISDKDLNIINITNQDISRETIRNYSIITRDLQFGYNKNDLVLNQLNLDLEIGKIYSLHGPNGSGKSTLLKCLTGELRINHGLLYIYGNNLKKSSTKINKLIGYLPQSNTLWNSFTAYEHLKLFSLIKIGSLNCKNEIDDLLRKVRLFDVRNNKVGTFSGGMKRRLSIAMALLGSPKLLILDEPTNAVDVSTRQFIWDIIKELKQDKTIILATHSLQESQSLADQVLVLSNGYISKKCSPIELKEQYSSGILRLNLTTTDNEKALSHIRNHLHVAIIEKEETNSIIININKDPEISSFIQLLSVDSEIQTSITDWSISEIELEDAYNTILKKDK